MAKTFAVVNQKGGVGKTTTCVSLATAVQMRGRKVLCCDFDPQGNATSGFGIDKNDVEPSIYDVVIGNAAAEDAVVHTKWSDVLPANRDLAGASVELAELDHRESRLKNALKPLQEEYDFIFIDCPPSLELLTLNGLCAADGLLVPVQCEYYALEGLTDLLSTVKIVRKNLNPSLAVDGVILTMYDSRTKLSSQVAEEIRKHFPGQVYRTRIPRNVRLSEAPSHGEPVFEYDKRSRGAKAYRDLAAEFLKKNGKK
ncbi:MAG: AAA family ATPase [Oscillospiraceae bacterium]|nr:AAA family ATPase [Oscillospiraceae bacterium]